MEYVSNGFDVLTASSVFIVGLVMSCLLGKPFSVPANRSVLLYLWHSIFCLVYAWYVVNDGGDSIMYYRMSLSHDLVFHVGTAGVVYLTAFFSQGLGLSLIGVFLVYNIIGYIGLLAFYAGLKAVTAHKELYIQRLVLLIIFLPSVSFWSSSIGKDAISFTATALALWSSMHLKNRLPLMVAAILMMLLVRPHMAGLIVIGLSASFVLHANVSILQRIVFGCVALGAAVVIVPFSLEYAGVGNGSDVDTLLTYVEGRQAYNQTGGGGVDISQMSLPMQLITYMFRPLPFEANSIFQLASSMDNLILLYLFFVGGYAIAKGKKSSLGENRTFLWVYALLSWLILAMTTANMGISARQKWMFVPVLIYLLISVLGEQRAVTRVTPKAHGGHST
ncbi:hypothetical protein [Aidingimonas lacisalsi]|uniref:hypothetical protein n=1 Tax=Aidingimonas lacisalsi TaxID=2604086 RepID=UPI0011D1F1DD|nr:hypothetical protein [Aidingimonas lacisalsi]